MFSIHKNPTESHLELRRVRAVRLCRALLAIAALCCIIFSIENSWATSLAKPLPRLLVTASPTLGDRAPASNGWYSVSALVENVTDQTIEGELVLEPEYRLINHRFNSRAPISVAGRSRVQVELPARNIGYSGTPLVLKAISSTGELLGSVEIGAPASLSPLIFDLESPSRIGAALQNKDVYVDERARRTSLTSSTVVVTGARGVRGDLLLPVRAAGYSGVSLVLAKSETLATLPEARLIALGDWLLSGGALAVYISREEDTRLGPLPVWLGGVAQQSAPAAELRETASFLLPQAGGYRSWSNTPTLQKATPTPELKAGLVSYLGGNLKPSPWGASASYGLGEIHLLAFDATSAPHVDDEWVQLKTQDLLRHAWTRQASIVFPHAALDLGSSRYDEIRKELDPNESARWTIVFSAILLLIYAGVAGPFSFFRAAKQNRPLRAYLHLPLYALGTAAIILMIGVVSKGVRGRALHLSLIETGAGMTRAPITRFRGFYDSSAESLDIYASSSDAVLDLAGADSDSEHRTLIMDRVGAHLHNITARPWQIVLIREDDFVSLGSGISIVETQGGATIVNRSQRPLVSVLAKLPGKPARYFASIPDGGSVKYQDGLEANSAIGRSTGTGYQNLLDSRLGTSLYPDEFDKDSQGGVSAWKAIDSASNPMDWWPAEVPVLIAQFDGGEGKLTDAGLRLTKDRVLVRVVGWGGQL